MLFGLFVKEIADDDPHTFVGAHLDVTCPKDYNCLKYYPGI